MLIHDLGVTFGKATLMNNTRVDFAAWQSQSVWKDPGQCVGNQRKSMTGTLEYPRIGEAGRKFLADLPGRARAAEHRRELAVGGNTPPGNSSHEFEDGCTKHHAGAAPVCSS